LQGEGSCRVECGQGGQWQVEDHAEGGVSTWIL